MKDNSLILLTFLLSLIVGGAEAFSVDAGKVHRTVYAFIHSETGRVFETEIASREEKKFQDILTQDKTVLGSGRERPSGKLPEYYLLETRSVKKYQPYLIKFSQGFVFVWMIYWVIGYLVKHLVIREFKQSLKQKRRKPRRKK